MMWKKEYELGYPDIDNEHRQFVRLISDLKGMSTLTEKETLIACMDRIKTYAQHHFFKEEQRMHRTGFPEMIQHQNDHQKLLMTFEQTRQDILSDRKTVYELIDFMVEWFAFHTTGMDTALAQHLIQWDENAK